MKTNYYSEIKVKNLPSGERMVCVFILNQFQEQLIVGADSSIYEVILSLQKKYLN